MWNSTVSTVIWLWAAGSARDLSLLQRIHTSHIAYTFCYSIGTTGSNPESGQGTTSPLTSNYCEVNKRWRYTSIALVKSHDFFCGAATQRGSWPPHSWGLLDHTQRTTVGRTPLDKWSARCRDLYLTTHNTHRQTSMPPVGFEPTISAGERPQPYTLDHAATGTGKTPWYIMEKHTFTFNLCTLISEFRYLFTIIVHYYLHHK